MSAFYGWSISICLSAVAASIFELLIPKGNMEKMFRFILGVFMVCIILVPINNVVSSIKNNITIQKYQYQDGEYNSYVNEQYINSAKEVIYNKSLESLSDMGVNAKSIDVTMDIDNDNNISMVLVEITLPKSESDNKQKIENTIYDNIGIECKVYIEGND